MKLTQSKQHYIQAIYLEQEEGKGARVSDLAESLGVSKASVSRAVKELEEISLVERNASRHVLLTKEGVKQAVLLADRFYIVKHFLLQILKCSLDSADADACALEHLLSAETLCSMASMLHKYRQEGGEKMICDLETCPWPKTQLLFER